MTAPVVLPGGRGPARDVSVVVPALNEAASLGLLAERVRATLDGEGLDWELIVVDDGSTDGSAAVLADLVSDRIRGIRLAGNHGKSAALACGIAEARGRVVVMMDADLQDLPEEMPSLLEPLRAGRLDFAQGWRTDRQDTAFKRVASAVFNGLCTTASGLRVHDVNCGYKAMTLQVARRVRLSRGLHRFLPVLAWRQGFRVGEIPVRHAHRAFGRSRYGALRYLQGLNDLVSVVLLPRLLQWVAPLLAPVGLLALGLSGAAGLVLLWMFATARVGALWETGLSTLALFLTGLLAMALGTIERVTSQLEQAEQPRVWTVAERYEATTERSEAASEEPSEEPSAELGPPR